MAYQGPSYGLSRECAIKAQSKFDLERAQNALDWVEEVIGEKLEYPDGENRLRDQTDFSNILKNGVILCRLINRLKPDTVKKINTMNAPFKQRENVEMYLKGCVSYGLKAQDLFQVNDLYESKNLYMVVDNIYNVGGMAQKMGYNGALLGVKVAQENKREFDQSVLKAGQSVIGLQYGSNKGASQAGMTAYGTGRQIRPDELGRGQDRS